MRRLIEHYRFPESVLNLEYDCVPSPTEGFFYFGDGNICYGSCSAVAVSKSVRNGLPDASADVRFDGPRLRLPFDADLLIDNLLMERYPADSYHAWDKPLRSVYYSLRPLLPVGIRKYMQRAYLKGWEKIQFPHWPVDSSVEQIMEKCVALAMQAQNLDRVPFIWFWPNGSDSCAIVTHDVEAEAGRDFCSALMDIDDSFGIKAAFQVIPEDRYSVSEEFLSDIRDRGFEINIHDLNHDGNLFLNEEQFMRRVIAVNAYGKKFKAVGFRAGIMYRNQRWCHALDFQYDMSVPNAAHLEPQRGGCCSIFPYFIGKLLELPLTTTQDYALFHFLGDYSLKLWDYQIDTIRKRHGLISILVHPDYIKNERAQEIYRELLSHLAEIRDHENVWMAKPGEVNDWWRIRNALTLVRDGDDWRITGPGCERARIAYARLENGGIRYELAPSKCEALETTVVRLPNS
jgi:hypothetical protein